MTAQSPMLDVMHRVATGPAPVQEPPKTTRELVWDQVKANPWVTQEDAAKNMGMQKQTVYYNLRMLVRDGLVKAEKREKRRNKDDRNSFTYHVYHVTTPEEMAALTGLSHKVASPRKLIAKAAPKPVKRDKPPVKVAKADTSESQDLAERRAIAEGRPVPSTPQPAAPVDAPHVEVAATTLAGKLLQCAPPVFQKVSFIEAMEIYNFLRPTLG